MGTDRLYGGHGSDIFVIDKGFGRNTIFDFQFGNDGHDVIQISLGTTFDTFDEVFAAGKQVGSDAVFTFGGQGVLTIANVSIETLTANDFNFG